MKYSEDSGALLHVPSAKLGACIWWMKIAIAVDPKDYYIGLLHYNFQSSWSVKLMWCKKNFNCKFFQKIMYFENNNYYFQLSYNIFRTIFFFNIITV